MQLNVLKLEIFSPTSSSNFIPVRPLKTQGQPYNEKTLQAQRKRVFDYVDLRNQSIPIVPNSWVANTILESSLVVFPDGLPRK